MIRLYLMGFKGFRVLEDLIEKFGPGEIEAVVAETDPVVQKDYYPEIKGLCAKSGVKFYSRKNAPPAHGQVSIAVSWRWLIMPSDNLIVVHDSLLPKYRGFNPLVTALVNGDKKIGATAIFAAADYDSGNIISQSAVNITYPVKIDAAIQKVSGCYCAVVGKVVRHILENKQLPSVRQDESRATYSLWRDDADYRVDWSMSASAIQRFVDATGFPYKGASSVINGAIYRVIEAQAVPDLKISNRCPGKVIFIRQNTPFVVCGKGILRILEMRDEKGNVFVLKKTRTRFE